MPALAVIAIGTAVGSIYSSNEARKATKESARAEQRRAEVQNIRNVRQSIREARLAQGSLVSQGAAAGTLGSSGVAGGMSSISSQLGSNLNYLSQIAEENTSIFNSSLKSAQYQANAQIFGTISSAAAGAYQGQSGESVGGFIGRQAKKIGLG